MKSRSVSKYVKEHLHELSDLMAVNGAHIVAWKLTAYGSADFTWIFVAVLITNMLGLVVGYRSHQVNRSWGYGRHLVAALRFAGVQFLIGSVINLLIFEGAFSEILGTFCAALLALSAIGRLGLTKFLRTIRQKGYNYRRIVVVGSATAVETVAEEMRKKAHYGYKFLASFGEDLEYTGPWDSDGVKKDIYDFLVDAGIDEVFVSIHVKPEKVKSLFTFCQLNGIVIHITHEFLDGLKLEPMDISISTNGISPTLTIKEDWYAAMVRTDGKRLFDFIFSGLFLLLVASWLFPLIALAIKLNSRGPVFFTQIRSGLNGGKFLCYKFRTMYVNLESDSKQATKNDPRITSLGRILRTTNLDELPQFINVLLGDMSIVGPRPHMLKHTEEFAGMVADYNERLWIRPGITGLSQSLGFRGEIQEFQQLISRVDNDRKYVRNWSLSLDFRIILSTAWNMLSFRRTGA